MTPTIADWRYKDEVFKNRSYLMSSLVRLRISLSSDAYEFCDFTISQGWNPPSNYGDCDMQVLDMYVRYLREVKNG